MNVYNFLNYIIDTLHVICVQYTLCINYFLCSKTNVPFINDIS